MKVGEKGHYLQTEVIIVFKAKKGPTMYIFVQSCACCALASMLFNSRTGTSSTELIFVIL